MTDDEFFEAALEAGFSRQKAAFFVKFVARNPHSHTADQIKDLADEITDILEDMEEEQ